MAEVQVQARDTGDRYSAPSTNTALQLASSLADLNPSINNLTGQIAKQEAEKQAALAKKDALSSSGARLADAVRSGSILPTQNPWYVQAYNRESSVLRSQDQLSSLASTSATWPEQNDPQQFAKRWRTEVGKLASGLTDKDEIAGFSAAEGQVTQQTLASNQASNVHRITEERTNNISMLTSEAILDASRRNAGTVDGTILAQAIEPAHLRFTATGGSEQDWHKIVVASVTSAAYNSQNAGLLDTLKDPALIGGPALQTVDEPTGATPPTSQPVSQPFGEQDAAQALKAVFGKDVVITSQDRSAVHNAKIGGAKNSMHLTGQAVDFTVPGYTQEQVQAALKANGYPVSEFLHEKAGDAHSTGDHFHWGWRGANNHLEPQTPDTHSAKVAAGPSLYDQAGVADNVEHDRYVINSNAVETQLNQVKVAKAVRDQKGQAGADMLLAKHGTAILAGDYDVNGLTKELLQSGYSAPDVASVFNVLHSNVTDSEGLMNARMNLNGADPTKAKGILDLALEGKKNGWTADYENRVGHAVLSGQIKGSEGQQMVSDALSRSREVEKEGGGATVKNFAGLGQHAGSLAGTVVDAMSRNYGTKTDYPDQLEIKRSISNAMGSWLERHPGDFQGAYQYGSAQAAQMLTRMRQAHINKPKAPSVTGQAVTDQSQSASAEANPRRVQ